MTSKLLTTALLLCLSAVGEQASNKGASIPPKPQATPPQGVTIDSVIAMVQAGISDEVILARLKKGAKQYDLTPADMIRLKKANVSDTVVRVMIDPTTDVGKPSAVPQPQISAMPAVQILTIAAPSAPVASGATPILGAPTSGDPNDPLTPHDSGIYIYTVDRSGKPQMLVLERAAYQGAKTSGVFAASLTGGIMKAKEKAVIPGTQASLNITDPTPTFYFYFDDKASGLGKTSFGSANLSNPNQFALLRLEVTKTNRVTTIAEVGAFGASSGSDPKAMITFKSERIRPGLYKVVIHALHAGQYCFFASSGYQGAHGAGAAGAVDIFDFSYSNQ